MSFEKINFEKPMISQEKQKIEKPEEKFDFQDAFTKEKALLGKLRGKAAKVGRIFLLVSLMAGSMPSIARGVSPEERRTPTAGERIEIKGPERIEIGSLGSMKDLLKTFTNERLTPQRRELITKLLREKCLETVGEVNRLHEESPRARLNVIKDYSATELYSILVFGNDEVFTSTFNLIFNGAGYSGREKKYSLIDKMGAENLDGYKLLKKADPRGEGLGTFLRTCAQFGRLGEFLNTVRDPEQKRELLEKFLGVLEKSTRPVFDAVAVIETMDYLNQGRDEELIVLEDLLKEKHARTIPGSKVNHLYGIIAALHSANTSSKNSWFNEMQKKHEIPNLTELESEDLFRDNICVERQYFYNDEDGRTSFEKLLSSSRRDPSWKVIDRGTYIILEKESPKTNKKIVIFANRPDSDLRGDVDISKAMAEGNLKVTVVAHRGHSYHLVKTVERIPASARLVFTGSCGGFRSTAYILDRAPEVQVIATRGIGTTGINHLLSEMINNSILTGEKIHWSDFWKKAQGKIQDKRFRDYVPPHKNTATLVFKMLRK